MKRYFSCLAIVGLSLLLAVPALAGYNNLEENQTGAGNTSNSFQYALADNGNDGYIDQIGTGNDSYLLQDGAFNQNFASIWQEGDLNEASVVQGGFDNTINAAFVEQYGGDLQSP